MSTRSLWTDDEPQPRKRTGTGDAYLDGIMERTRERAREIEPSTPTFPPPVVDPAELTALMLHERFNQIQRLGSTWTAYSRSTDKTTMSFTFGAGRDPITAIRMSLGIKD